MNIKKGISGLFCALAVSALLSCAMTQKASAAPYKEPVSPALYILAEESDMAMAGIRGNSISFSGEDFCRAMNLSKLYSITVTKVPALTDGELRLGNTVVTSGQTISASDLSRLTYTQSGANIYQSSFRFSVNGSPVDVTCNLYLLEEYNECPTLSPAGKNFTDVSTHRDVTLYGTLPFYDPEGD